MEYELIYLIQRNMLYNAMKDDCIKYVRKINKSITELNEQLGELKIPKKWKKRDDFEKRLEKQIRKEN